MGNTIQVKGTETLDEIYFLVRVGTWHPEQLEAYIASRVDDAYNQGAEDSRQDGYSSGDMDDAYSRGFDQGHSEGFKDGYAQGSQESSYDDRF